MQINHFSRALSLFLAVGSTAVTAANTPDAGSLQQQMEQGLRAVPAPQEEIKVRPQKSLGNPRAGAVTVTVSQFEFRGNTQLSTEQLNDLVAPYQHRPLDLTQLKQIADVVANAYREAGWLVRVVLPEQEIRNGVVVLQIVEAIFGKTQIRGVQSRVDSAFLQGMVEQAQAPGAPVSAQRIDRALLLLDDLPGLSAAGNLIEGEQAGQTDLLLGVADRAGVNGSVTVDNTGARSTGTERLMASMNIHSPLKLGDSLGLIAFKTQGSEYQRVGYSVPVGFDGLRAGGHATHLVYGLVGDFANLQSNGSAYTSGLDVSYPWLRSQLANVSLTTSYDSKRLDNNANGASVSHYGITAWTLGLNASQIDNWAGGGASSASVNLVSGSVNLDGSANQSVDASGPATAGRYSKLNFGLSRLQNLSNDLSAYVAVNVQRANKNLDSSERLYLGGANGVRAYPSSEGGGGEGMTFTTELRQKLEERITLTGFYDHGRITAYKNNAYANGSGSLNSGNSPNSFALRGYGMSLAWQPKSGTELRATLARRVGDSPIANTSTGLDGDGTKKLNRLWVSATVSF